MYFKRTIIGAAAAGLLATPALAGDRDRAMLAISQAQASVQLASNAGAENWAAETQAQANVTLEKARRYMAKSKEHRAFYAAREADAYARLAFAKAQTRTLATPTSY